MKRLSSLDFLRGVAVFGMTIFHVFGVSQKLEIPSDITELSPFILILGIIVINFQHWRGFFIMISGVVNTYQMFRAFESGKTRIQILGKQLFSGIILILLGKLLITYFYFYGIIDNWTRSGGWNRDFLTMFFYFDTIESLGFMMILSGLTFFFLSYIPKKNICVIVSFFTLLMLAIVIIIVSPTVHEWVGQIAGVAISSDTELFRSFGYAFDYGISEKTIRIFLNAIGGREAPLFPMWGAFLVGEAISILLLHTNLRKWMLRLVYLPCFLMILWGVYEFIFLFGIENLNPFFHVFPRWYSFLSVGTQAMVIILFLIRIEFNHRINKDRWLRGTKYFRRFGVFALTVYFFQLLEAGPRLLFGVIFGIETEARSQLSVIWTIIMIITNILLWSGLLYASDRWLHGVGSWEWILMVVRNPIKWWKSKRKGLDLHGMLHNVEMIQFLDGKRTEA